MKKLILLLLITTLSGLSYAQEKKNYYVYANTTTLYDSTSIESNSVTKLSKHSNLKFIKTIDEEWLQVEYAGKLRFGLAKDFKSGKAVVTKYSVRTGARCKDGSYSSATGRGACSHHKGVRNWITSTRERVRIEK